MKNILVVEDDKKINELIVEFLKSEGYFVDFALDGIEGFYKFNENSFDLVILDAMADDYITKPFSFNILIKRVEAVLRRSGKREEKIKEYKSCINFEKLKMDLDTYKVYIDEDEIELTLKEFNILKFLIEAYPRVLSREMLMNEILGYDYYGDMRVIDAHIKNIRKKIVHDYIGTVKGIGYVLKK